VSAYVLLAWVLIVAGWVWFVRRVERDRKVVLSPFESYGRRIAKAMRGVTLALGPNTLALRSAAAAVQAFQAVNSAPPVVLVEPVIDPDGGPCDDDDQDDGGVDL
jgi:hypothetical protein